LEIAVLATNLHEFAQITIMKNTGRLLTGWGGFCRIGAVAARGIGLLENQRCLITGRIE
jgi:hypothetical protein